MNIMYDSSTIDIFSILLLAEFRVTAGIPFFSEFHTHPLNFTYKLQGQSYSLQGSGQA